MVVRFPHTLIMLPILVLISLQVSAVAQDVQATARVDSNTIVIGDWLNVYVEVQRPGNVTLGQPHFTDSLAGFDIVKIDPPTTTQSNDRSVDKVVFTVTAFDSGMYVFPALTVPYRVGGDTTQHSVLTSPIPVTVHGIAVDTAQAIKDIKPPLTLPLTFAEILPYIIGVLIFVGIGWLIYYVLKKRKKGESIIPQAPPRPAHEIALEALRSLESEHLWQRGKVKEYHSTVTEIIRQYIERRFSVMALEQTSEEILASGPISLLSEDLRAHLRNMFTRADLVKFAKYQPVPEENEKTFSSAMNFVQSTVETKTEPETETAVQETNA